MYIFTCTLLLCLLFFFLSKCLSYHVLYKYKCVYICRPESLLHPVSGVLVVFTGVGIAAYVIAVLSCPCKILRVLPRSVRNVREQVRNCVRERIKAAKNV